MGKQVLSLVLALSIILTITAFRNNAHADFAKGLAAYDAGDYELALTEWSKDAESGDLAAQRNLGHLFRWGKGVEKNLSRAAYWYHRAASSGFDRAQYNLALLYLNGEGVPKDKDEAIRWIKLSAEQGNTEAEEKLKELVGDKELSKIAKSTSTNEEITRKEKKKAKKAKNKLTAITNVVVEPKPEIPKEKKITLAVEEGPEKETEEKIVKAIPIKELIEKEKAESKPAIAPIVEPQPTTKPTRPNVVANELQKIEDISESSYVAEEDDEEENDIFSEEETSTPAAEPISKPAEIKVAAENSKPQEATTKPVEAPKTPETEAPTPKTETKKVENREEYFLVHIASYKDRKTAEEGWHQLIKKSADLETFDMEIIETNIKNKGLFFRLYAKSNFDNAKDLCTKMRKKEEYCIVTDSFEKRIF